MILSHGKRIRIEYFPLPGTTESAVGESTEEQRPGGQLSGVVSRYKKDESGFFSPQALGWIKGNYQNAIEYTSIIKELKGMPFAYGIFSMMIPAAGIYMSFTIFLFVNKFDFFSFFYTIIGISTLIASLAFGAYIFLLFMRFDLFRPSDLPIIFDRKHRKIYRILREEQPGFKGAFKNWPLVVCEYDWDLVDAEHEAEIFTTGGGITHNHFLMFLVRKSKDDPSIIDSFQIANASSLSNELTDSMWEHIRRFMEENGPHLPTPDEPLASMEPPGSWWQSMGAVGPYGPNYFQHWRDAPGMTLVLHLLFPVTLPMLFLWGTGNWLSYKTAIPVEWPEEVLAAIGPSTHG